MHLEVATLIRQRLKDLGFEQKDLAAAADVTESYISQLLRSKKTPPASDRTDIYDKLGKFLKLPSGELAKLADHQRKHELKKKIEDPPAPLFKEVRELILRKCKPEKRDTVRSILERQPFGELERLVTQKLLDVVKNLAREELAHEHWLRAIASKNGRSYKQMRASALEFLDADVLAISHEACLTFMDPLIVSWDIDLVNFGLEIVLNRRIVPTPRKRFEFTEKDDGEAKMEAPGFRAFLKDPKFSGDATDDEIQILKRIRFANNRRPTAFYYYRELQNLRDLMLGNVFGPEDGAHWV